MLNIKVKLNDCIAKHGTVSGALVTVNGGSKMVEGDKSKGLENGATIQLAAGLYTLPSLSEYEGITIIGDENGGTVIGGENATTGFGSNFGKNTTIKNVTFSGSTNGVRYSYAKGGKTTFEKCTFAGGSTYGFHIDKSNGAEFEFTNCTFSGFNAFAGDLTSVTFNNCTFKSNGNYGHTNIWSVGRFNNCTWEDKTSVSGAGDNAKFNLPMSYTAATLAWSYLENTAAYKQSG